MTALNSSPRSTLNVPCLLCKGRGCRACMLTGVVEKKACQRCGGTGSEARVKDLGGKCRDCRGEGWRDIDNVKNWD